MPCNKSKTYHSAFQIKSELGVVLQSLHFWVLLGPDTHNPSKQRWKVNIDFFFWNTKLLCHFKQETNQMVSYSAIVVPDHRPWPWIGWTITTNSLIVVAFSIVVCIITKWITWIKSSRTWRTCNTESHCLICKRVLF